MNTPSKVYVLRVWFEPSLEGEVWRASVSLGEERRYFSEPLALTEFLQSQFPQSAESRLLSQPAEPRQESLK